MASFFSDEHLTATSISGASSLVVFLKRGLEYVQRGYYTEGVAFLAFAREQLAPDQKDLANVLGTFLHQHANYRCAQKALQEVTAHFAEVYAELQAQAANFATVLPTLIRDLDTQQSFPSPSPQTKDRQEPLSLCLLPQHFQELPSLTLQLDKKDGSLLPELSINCFGRFEVRRLNQSIVLCSNRNGQSILRYLVAQPGHRATIDTLMAMLWPEDEPEVAQPKLHIAISALRRSLNRGYNCEPGCGYILCKNQIYHLNPEVVIQTDVDEFLQCYQAGRQAGEERTGLYEKACRLYAGPFLTEDMYADWSFLQREQLRQAYLAMCGVLAEHYLAINRYEDAAKWATAILKENRCEEAAHRQLIRIYAAQGRRSEALQQYQRCERVLREELGVQPLPETVHAIQTLFTGELTSQK